ncbi:hypothetical protein [Actinomyces sp.]|uniref:hypothetical protein n=1 Tax=Actinomyces sp. TaxID=29317 RepID=UPI0026DADE62|nr:hypothetical protein [Actinomyces sp.]MDO4900297.1 hypothetical protein [Actinomyces sp.]
MTGRYPVSSSAAFTATVSAPEDTELDPSTNTVTQNTALDRTASVAVTKTQDKETVASGETRTYTVTYTNTGTTDVNGLRISDFYAFNPPGTNLAYSINCDPTSTAPCPTWANGTTIRENSGNRWISLNRTTDLPAGTSLILTIPLTHTVACLAGSSVTGNNQASFTLPDDTQATPGTITSQHINGTIRTTDVTTVTSVSTTAPEPGQEMNVTAEVTNGCGAATDVPVTITLPKNAFTVDDDATPTCSATGGATCPSDLTYDPVTHTVTGTVPSLPQGSSVVLSVTGNAGIAATFASSQLVTTTAPDRWDLAPDTNTSSTTFALSNTRTRATVTHTIQGLPASGAPEAMTFDGTLACQASGTHSVSVTVPAGSSQGQLSSTSLIWLHDTCTLTVTRPDAPARMEWHEDTPTDITESTGEVTGPITYAFTWVLTGTPSSPNQPPTGPSPPLTGGTGADIFLSVGAGMILLALTNAVLRRHRRIGAR